MPWVSVCMCVACLMPPPSPNQSGYTFSPDLELDRHLHSSTKKLPSQQHNDDLRCVCFSYGYDFVCEKERKISLKHCNKHFSFLTHSDQTTSGNCALHERAATNNSIFLLKKASWTITTPHYTCQFHRKSCSLLLRSVVLLALSDVVSNV